MWEKIPSFCNLALGDQLFVNEIFWKKNIWKIFCYILYMILSLYSSMIIARRNSEKSMFEFWKQTFKLQLFDVWSKYIAHKWSSMLWVVVPWVSKSLDCKPSTICNSVYLKDKWLGPLFIIVSSKHFFSKDSHFRALLLVL